MSTPDSNPAETSFLAGLLRAWFGALPVGLNHDILYLWATFRLRHRPIKMLGLLVILGAACYVWEWIGQERIVPVLLQNLAVLPPGFMRETLMSTSRAIFSSLNILSCITICIMARTLRHLLKEGHMESLMLVPARIRPSSLFYAVSTRYAPLAFVAILVIYLDPKRSPFTHYPFQVMPPQMASPSMWPLYWAGLRELAVALYCTLNLYSDLAMSYWLLCRFRVTYPTTIWAVIVIGVLSPIGLMAVHEWIGEYVRTNIWRGTGIFGLFTTAAFVPQDPNTVENIAGTIHYSVTGILSGISGYVALADLDGRWYRVLRSKRRDPVMIRPLD